MSFFRHPLHGGLALDAAQRAQVEELVRDRSAEWRYQLSQLGLPAYLQQMHDAKGFTGAGLLAHATADPKSMLRALRSSFARATPAPVD